MTWDNIADIDGVALENKVGFVYKVTSKKTGKIYYGIKRFWKTVKYPPLKGKTNKRHKVFSTDWRFYKTSSPTLQNELIYNKDHYYCEIVRVCNSITEMKAYEAYYQLEHYVKGEWDLLINEVINLRLRIR